MGAPAPVRTRPAPHPGPAERAKAGRPGPADRPKAATPRAQDRPRTADPSNAGRTQLAAGVAAVPAPRPALRPKLRSKAVEMFCSSPIRCTGALLVVAAVVFGLVLLNIHVAQTSFRLSDLQREAAELQQEQRRLRFEVARAESPEKIVEMSASLGLVPPTSQEFMEGPSLLVADSTPVVEKAASRVEQDPAPAPPAGSGE